MGDDDVGEGAFGRGGVMAVTRRCSVFFYKYQRRNGHHALEPFFFCYGSALAYRENSPALDPMPFFVPETECAVLSRDEEIMARFRCRGRRVA